MKKVMFSVVEKRLIRSMLILGLVQILILIAFIRMFNIGQPVSTYDTKQADIIVEDIYLISSRKEQHEKPFLIEVALWKYGIILHLEKICTL